MSRPKKIGLEYFPVDVDFDDKINAIELLHGNDGLCWVIKFWQSCYKTEFGEINIDGLFGELHANKCRITLDIHQKILDTALKVGFCYQDSKTGNFTSSGVKKRLGMVSKEREEAIKRQEERSKEEKKEEKKSKVKECPSYSANNSRIKNKDKENILVPSHLLDVWPDYLAMRAKIRKPATTRAEKNIIAELERLSPNDHDKQIKIVEQSITNSWQGVFELTNASRQNKPKSREERLSL
jgi:hypothetical protein